jgi:hypothetical protein
MRDLANNLNLRPAFTPAAAVVDNTVQTSGILDRVGYESVMLALVTGVESDTDATFAVAVTESDNSDMSNSNPVDPSNLIGTMALASFDFAADIVARKIGYVGGKRYVQASITPANNTGNLFVAGMWVLAGARNLPTSQIPS